MTFQSCFKRKAAYKWFVIIIIGLIVRPDHLGVTSIIRGLSLEPGYYETMLHFFRSRAWDPGQLRAAWYRYLLKEAPVYKVCGRTVMAGDGVKQSKEAFFMPGVKKMVQESEDSSKGEFIFGHLFGAVGVIAGEQTQKFCIPLKIDLQDGVRAAASWKNSHISMENHIIQMVRNGFEAAKTFGDSILLLDRYFLSVPALKLLDELNTACGNCQLVIVTKAKKSCIAYQKPAVQKKKKRGRPRKKGKAVKIASLFNDPTVEFQKTNVFMYGEEQEISYYCIDLLWGQKLYRELRFVLVNWNGLTSILVSTDISMSAQDIIELYALRQKIECLFRELKQQIGGFCYHFWTKAMPRLDHFSRKSAPDPLTLVTDEKKQERILKCVKAIEGFVLCSTISMGIVQLVALKENQHDDVQKLRYLRTQTSGKLSEATVMYYIRKNFILLLMKHPDSFVTQFIRERQIDDSGNSSSSKDGAA